MGFLNEEFSNREYVLFVFLTSETVEFQTNGFFLKIKGQSNGS